jgi:hypothetical protein
MSTSRIRLGKEVRWPIDVPAWVFYQPARTECVEERFKGRRHGSCVESCVCEGFCLTCRDANIMEGSIKGFLGYSNDIIFYSRRRIKFLGGEGGRA